jgi:hypothetical protein
MDIRVLLLTGFLLAHDWYPAECCSGQDCHPVPCEEIDGNLYRNTIFPSVRQSLDDKCHACFIERHGYEHGKGELHYIVPFCLFTQKGIS